VKEAAATSTGVCCCVLCVDHQDLPDDVKAAHEDAASQYNVGWSHGKEALRSGLKDTHKGSFYANPLQVPPTPTFSLQLSAVLLLSVPLQVNDSHLGSLVQLTHCGGVWPHVFQQGGYAQADCC